MSPGQSRWEVRAADALVLSSGEDYVSFMTPLATRMPRIHKAMLHLAWRLWAVEEGVGAEELQTLPTLQLPYTGLSVTTSRDPDVAHDLSY